MIAKPRTKRLPKKSYCQTAGIKVAQKLNCQAYISFGKDMPDQIRSAVCLADTPDMLGSATAGSGQVRGREASNWLRFIVRPWQACRELPASAAGDLKGKDGGDLPTQESNEFPFNVFPSPGLCFPILIWPLA